MVRFQNLQPCHFHVQIHLLPDQRITCAERLDLRIGQRLLVHIVTGSDRRFAGHDLADKFLLVLQRLVQISIKGSLRHVLENLHLRVLVSLTDDTAIALRHIRRPPAHIQVMDGNQPILHIRPCPHFLGTAQKHTHLTGADFGKEFFLFCFRIRVMDESDLCFRNPPGCQLGFDVIVYIKRAIIFRSGQIAENKLRQLPVISLFPDPENIIYAGIQFAPGIIREQRVHQPLVKADFPSIGSDLQHVIDRWIDAAVVYLSRTFRQRCHHFFLDFGRLHHHRFKVCLRNRKIQLVAGLDIRHFLEHGHQLRQIEELREPCPCPVTGSFRSQLDGCCGFTEGGSPAVKMRQTFLLQRPILEIPHDGIKLRHGVADRRAGSKDHALASSDLIHISALHKHI